MSFSNTALSDLGDLLEISRAQAARIETIAEDDDPLTCIRKLMGADRYYSLAEVLKLLSEKRPLPEDRDDLCIMFKQLATNGFFEAGSNDSYRLKKQHYLGATSSNVISMTESTETFTDTVYALIKSLSDKEKPEVSPDVHTLIDKMPGETAERVQGALTRLARRKHNPIYVVGTRPSRKNSAMIKMYSVFRPAKPFTAKQYGATQPAVTPVVRPAAIESRELFPKHLVATPIAVPSAEMVKSELIELSTKEFSFDDLREINAFKKKAGGSTIEAYELFKLKRELQALTQ
jgi:hypothetical protein